MSESSWHSVHERSSPGSLSGGLVLIQSRGGQTCSVKSQLVNISGSVGLMVCVTAIPLFGS